MYGNPETNKQARCFINALLHLLASEKIC